MTLISDDKLEISIVSVRPEIPRLKIRSTLEKIRNPNIEIRNNVQITKIIMTKTDRKVLNIWKFENSNLFRISDFVLRI